VKQLFTPRWITAHLGVVVIAVVFISLGFWQLGRLDERQLENAVAMSRYQAPPEDLSVLLQSAGDDYESLRYRRATVSGTYDASGEVLTRNQVYQDQAGFHVVDPLIRPDGGAVLVNRGWVPLALDSPPIEQALPPDGEVSIVGWINPSQTRPALGPVDPPDGDVPIFSRIDIARIQKQVGEQLDPVYLVLEGTDNSQLPVALPAPAFENEGNHLAYAIQWFGFALIGLVGYGFLVRRSLSKDSPTIAS
jgi:surfeit locus 1 family protein